MSTSKVYLVDGAWWHAACYHESVKSIDSPIRGLTIDRISPRWPKEAARDLCPSCAALGEHSPFAQEQELDACRALEGADD